MTSREMNPRYEFRVFSRERDPVAAAIRRRASCESTEKVDDHYCLAGGCTESNVKIRRGSLGCKRLIGLENDIELWRPAGKVDFPAPAKEAAGLVAEAFSLPDMEAENIDLSADEFVEAILRPHPSILLVDVFKHRFHFRLENCMVEIVELHVNGTPYQSIGVESEKRFEVENLLAEIGLLGRENVSYPRAIGRIVGLLPYPASAESGGAGNGQRD